MDENEEHVTRILGELQASDTAELQLLSLERVWTFLYSLEKEYDLATSIGARMRNGFAEAPVRHTAMLIASTWRVLYQTLRSSDRRVFCNVCTIISRFLALFRRIEEVQPEADSQEFAQTLKEQITRFDREPGTAEFPPYLSKDEPMWLALASYVNKHASAAALLTYEEILATHYEYFDEMIGEGDPSLADKLFGLRVLQICNGLQSLQMPTLVLLNIVDESTPNDFTDYKKWQIIVAVRHFLDRKRKAAGEKRFGFF